MRNQFKRGQTVKVWLVDAQVSVNSNFGENVDKTVMKIKEQYRQAIAISGQETQRDIEIAFDARFMTLSDREVWEDPRIGFEGIRKLTLQIDDKIKVDDIIKKNKKLIKNKILKKYEKMRKIKSQR